MTTQTDFEVIVVGAGSAGCVVASKLSQNSSRRVGLLDAGPGRDDAALTTPGRAATLPASRYVFPASTVPQRAAGDRVVPLVTGRVLGGGSSVNALGWFHAQPTDFDRWEAAGAVGWDSERMHAAVTGLEDHELGASAHHGAAGPMPVSSPRHLHPLALPMLRAGLELGWPHSDDLNGARRSGIGLASSNTRDGRRHSVVDAYLGHASQRPNLTIHTNTQVVSLLLDGDRVVGVRAVMDGEVRELTARDGVILAAGALRTPQLLMLSGIGPADHLRDHHIDVVLDRPNVGAGLQDHPAVPVPFLINPSYALHPDAEADYRLARRGPLSTLGQTVAVLAAGGRASDAAAAPELFLGLALLGDDAGLPAIEHPTGLVIVGLIDPDSAGTVRLASADPLDDPLVDPQYLAVQHDRERLREGVRLALQLLTAAPLRDAVTVAIDPVPESDDEIDRLIDASLTTYYHPVATARMGSEPGAVVDPQLRVRGLTSLWVTDASVMPRIPRALPHATTLALADVAADLIDAQLSAAAPYRPAGARGHGRAMIAREPTPAATTPARATTAWPRAVPDAPSNEARCHARGVPGHF